MFSNDEILQRLTDANLEELSAIEEISFDQWDFIVVGGEDTVVVHRGRKEGFSDAIDFYLKSHYRLVVFLMEETIDKTKFADEYLSKCIYQPISEDEFLKSARSYSKGLKQELAIDLKGQWIEGVGIFNEIDEFHAVAVTDLEYYSFFWMTTG